MNLCMSCLKTFKGHQIRDLEKNNKPYTLCYCKCGGDIVEIDELITPTIVELNKKGWTTEYCCSGHLNAPLIASYIKFKHHPQSKPVGFEINGDCIHFKNRDRMLVGLNGYKELLKINIILYAWALSLPVNNQPIKRTQSIHLEELLERSKKARENLKKMEG